MKKTGIFLFLFFIPCITFGEDPESIINKTYMLGKDPNIHMIIEMKISAKNGVKERVLDIYMKRTETTSKTLIHVISPGFLNKMKFLLHKDENGTDSKWMKTSKGVRRLSDANNSERVFDSDFTVEDFSGHAATDFKLTLLDTVFIGGKECFAIEAVPSYKFSDYSKKILKIDVDTMILREVDFFDNRGKKIKQYELIETQIINNNIYPLLCRMDNLKTDTNTTLHLQQVVVSGTLPNKIFNKGNL